MMTATEYARHRGCNESKVRKAVLEGRIEAGPDGRIDPEAADRTWAANSTGEDRQTGAAAALRSDPTIASARRRKNLVLAQKARDELGQLRAGLIPPAFAQRLVAEVFDPALARLRQVAELAAPMVAGRPAAEAERVLDTAINDAFVDIQAIDDGPRSIRGKARAEPDLDRMTNAGLEAMRLTYAATKMEVEQARDRGELVATTKLWAALEEQLGLVRANLMQLPGRCSNACQALDEPAARDTISSELEAAIAPLADQLAAAAPPLATPPGASPMAETMRAKWKDPDFRRRMSERIKRGMAKRKAEANGRQK